MKKSVLARLLITTLVGSLLVVGLFYYQSPSPPPAAPTDSNVPCDLGYYQRKVSQFSALPKTRPIVFYGDSRIDDVEWAELLERPDISNRGIGCDTTSGALQRLPESVPNSVKTCIIQIGINDLAQGTSIEKIVKDYGSMLTALKPKSKKIVATSIIYASAERAALNQRVEETNNRLKTICGQKNVIWLDLNRELCPQSYLPKQYSTDGVHLNGAACRVLKDTLTKSILPENGAVF